MVGEGDDEAERAVMERPRALGADLRTRDAGPGDPGRGDNGGAGPAGGTGDAT